MDPFDQTAPWSMESIRGCAKFLDRVWNLQTILIDGNEYSAKFEQMMHRAIKKVSSDIENMKFNTCISTFMTMVNEFYKEKSINKAEFKTFLQLLNPFAPHMTEELLHTVLDESNDFAYMDWPEYDESKTIANEITLPIQFNGKLKGTFYSDESIVNDIYDQLKTTSKGNYKFIMAASGQNHFPYLDKYKESDYDVKIKSTKYDKEATNMFRSYAQGIYDADKALNQLYKKIQNLDTPTIVVMFGDHQPYMGKKDNTSDYLQNSYFNTNDEIINDIRLHTTKAVILANFKLDTSDNLEFINSSYLGAYVLNKMDLKVSDYFKFIDYSRKTIPVFNRSVIYNSKTNTYTKMDQATKQEKGAINNYKNVQYYKFFDFE